MTTPTARRGAPHVTALAAAVALAACAFTLSAPAEGATTIELQLTPAGMFQPSDGRKMDVPAWRIDQAIATRVIERFNARQNAPVVDYEHQTLHKETNGQPAPAAAWMRALQWREGSGLWATVELTARAAQLIRDGEYRYVSPVFQYNAKTGDVLSIEMAAITNNPAIDGMEPLALRAAATFGSFTDPTEDTSMNKLLAALIAALGLSQDTNEDQAVAACASLKTKLDNFDAAAKAVGVDAGGMGDGAAVVAACSALQTKANAAPGAVDLTKYVSMETFEGVRTQLAALTAENVDSKVNALVEQGLKDGRLLDAQKGWATDLGKQNIAALTKYLETAQPIAALVDTQTGGRVPAGQKDEHGLTGAELAICTAAGIAPKDFAAQKSA